MSRKIMESSSCTSWRNDSYRLYRKHGLPKWITTNRDLHLFTFLKKDIYSNTIPINSIYHPKIQLTEFGRNMNNFDIYSEMHPTSIRK